MFTKAVVALALTGTALAQTFSIATPASLVECQPAAVSWTGGTSPFILAAIPGGQTSAVAIETINGALTASPYTWVVNLASGTNITLKITDATGLIQYSSAEVIQAGSSNACLNMTAATSGVATTGMVTTTNTASTTAAAVVTGTTSSSTMVSSMMSSSMMSSSMKSSSMMSSSMSASASSAGGVVGSATSAPASVATSAASAATSAAKSAGFASVVASVPALAAGLIGAAVALL